MPICVKISLIVKKNTTIIFLIIIARTYLVIYALKVSGEYAEHLTRKIRNPSRFKPEDFILLIFLLILT